MATVSSHRVTVGKTASSNSRMFLIGTFLILAGNDDMHESLDEFDHGLRSKLPFSLCKKKIQIDLQ